MRAGEFLFRVRPCEVWFRRHSALTGTLRQRNVKEILTTELTFNRILQFSTVRLDECLTPGR